MANGRFAYNPMNSVPKIAVTMVAIIEGRAGIPAAFRIAGFTTMMYDIVTKVVRPATASRPRVVPEDCSEKKSFTLGTKHTVPILESTNRALLLVPIDLFPAQP